MTLNSIVLSPGPFGMTIYTTTQLGLTGQSRTEAIDKAADIKYKHVCAVIVWKDDLETVAYYMLFTRKTGEWLGRTTTLRYLEDASKVKI